MQQKQKKLSLLHFIFSCHFILAYLGNPFQHSFWVVGLPAQKKAWSKRARALRPSQKEPVPTSLQDCRNSPDLPCNHATTVQPTSRLQVAWQPQTQPQQMIATKSLRHYVPEQKREALPKQSRQWLTIPEAMKFRDLRHCSVFVFTVLGVWSMKFILNSIGFFFGTCKTTAYLDQNGTPVWQVRKVTWNVCNAKAKLLAVVTWSAALGPCAAAQKICEGSPIPHSPPTPNNPRLPSANRKSTKQIRNGKVVLSWFWTATVKSW